MHDELQNEIDYENLEMRSIFFDGRKDTCATQKRTSKEEHITLIMELFSENLGFLSVEAGDAGTIESALYSFFSNNEISTDYLIVAGSDGTNVNVGAHNGVIRRLEVRIERPLQWSICLLHTNELPLRHLFQHLDGTSSGPQSFSGVIGKMLTSCEKLPIVKFEKITSSCVFDGDWKDLS